MGRELTKEEMMMAIKSYSEGEYSLMKECDGIKRHRITPLFRVEVLGEDLVKVYREEIPRLGFVDRKSSL